MKQKFFTKKTSQMSHKGFQALTCLTQKIDAMVSPLNLSLKKNTSGKNLFKGDQQAIPGTLKKSALFKKMNKPLYQNLETATQSAEEIILLADQKNSTDSLEVNSSDLPQPQRYSRSFFYVPLSHADRQEAVADNICDRLKRCGAIR